jgi:iodotyrosine deiodinase
MDQKAPTISYHPLQFPEAEMLARSSEFYQVMNKRRTVREFTDRPVPVELMENLIRTASTAPSGANKQPWTFCLIGNPEVKKKIRVAAEKEEFENYQSRMSPEWLADLSKIGTDWNKPFLEIAPWLVVVFKRVYELSEGGNKKNYYVNESVGLACGMFIAAVHQAGLVTLTHTPSPMDFLGQILNRPANERPFLLLPVGYAPENIAVPDIHRKSLDDVMVRY